MHKACHNKKIKYILVVYQEPKDKTKDFSLFVKKKLRPYHVFSPTIITFPQIYRRKSIISSIESKKYGSAHDKCSLMENIDTT